MNDKEGVTDEKKNITTENTGELDALFSAGVHYGYTRTRRHPSAQQFMFGNKNGIEIFDLEVTEERLKGVERFLEERGREGKVVLFVGGKNEARETVRSHAERVQAPYVAGRWIGGTFTNFEEIQKRIKKLDNLEQQKEKGELEKFTKKERLLIDREIEALESMFGGIRTLTKVPDVLVIVDARHEHNALEEAILMKVPVVSFSNSDCNFSKIDMPIPGNDSVKESIAYVVSRLADAYDRGKSQIPLTKESAPEEKVRR